MNHHISWRHSYSSDRRAMRDSRLSVFCCCLAIAGAVGAFAVAVLGMLEKLP